MNETLLKLSKALSDAAFVVAKLAEADGDVKVSVQSMGIGIHAADEDSFRALARVIGKADKKGFDDSFWLERKISPYPASLSVDVWAPSRDLVCTPKVIGKKLEKQRVLVQEAVYEEREIEVDDVVWECGSVLAPKRATT